MKVWITCEPTHEELDALISLPLEDENERATNALDHVLKVAFVLFNGENNEVSLRITNMKKEART